MLRYIVACALAFTLASPALAAKSSNLTGVRCETPEVRKHISDTMAKMVFVDNKRLVNSLVDNREITSIKTVRATADTLVCSLRLTFSYNGQPQSQRGRLKIRQYPDGTAMYEFAPAY